MTPQGVALQADGKIVITGGSTGIDGKGDLLVARFKANGKLDTSFGGGAGFVRLDVDGTASATSETGNDVAIQPDGKIVVVGTVTPQVIDETGGSVLVARFNANGTRDVSFGANGIKLGTPPAGTGWHRWDGRSVALMADGSIIVAGKDNWANNGDSMNPLLMRFSGASSSTLQASAEAASSSVVARPMTMVPSQPLPTQTWAGQRVAGVALSLLESVGSHAPEWNWSVVLFPRRRRIPQVDRTAAR